MKTCCVSAATTAMGLHALCKATHHLRIAMRVRLRFPASWCVLGPLLLLVVAVTSAALARRPTLLYLGCFAAHFGQQLWMTLVQGIVLYLNLPRDAFGAVQRHLFPKYFLLNSLLGAATLAIFLHNNPQPPLLQSGVLLLCLCCDACGFLLVVPAMVRLLGERDALAPSDPGRLLLRSRFRALHTAAAAINVAAIACNVVHLEHIAHRIS